MLHVEDSVENLLDSLTEKMLEKYLKKSLCKLLQEFLPEPPEVIMQESVEEFLPGYSFKKEESC